jgi:hypothetical protein
MQNHKYKLVYVRIQKTGSTAIIKHFTVCGSRTANPDTCLSEYLGQDRAVNEELWRSYFVFSTTRNPYARFVSIFNYLTEFGQDKPACASYPYTWPQFCFDPVTAMEYCRFHKMCCRGATFKEELYYRHTLPQVRVGRSTAKAIIHSSATHWLTAQRSPVAAGACSDGG